MLRVSLLYGLHYSREVFLKTTWAVGSAFAWRGGGTLEVQPRRRNASHPRWGCTRGPSVAVSHAAAFGPRSDASAG
jgi:hypothetical protein